MNLVHNNPAPRPNEPERIGPELALVRRRHGGEIADFDTRVKNERRDIALRQYQECMAAAEKDRRAAAALAAKGAKKKK